VLGAILLDNHALNRQSSICGRMNFFLDQHRRVFTQMIALGESQQAIDLVTLTEELNRKGELEASGARVPGVAGRRHAEGSNIEHYARIVKEKAILRNLIHTTHNIQQRAFEGEDGADAILDGAESDILRWRKTACALGCCRSRTLSATISSAWKEFSRKGRASPEFRRATWNWIN